MWGREKVNVSIFHRWLFSRLDVTAYVRTFTYMYIYMTHTICVWKGYSPYSLPQCFSSSTFYLYIHTYKFVFFYPFNIPSTTMIWHWNEKKFFSLLVFCGINCPYYVYVYEKEFFFLLCKVLKYMNFFLFFLPFFEYTNLRLRS